MKINIIYTYDNKAQEINTVPFFPILLENKNQFFQFLTTELSMDEKQNLVKISTALVDGQVEKNDRNKWAFDAHGKFWDNEIPALMLSIYGVETVYEPINK